MPNLYSPIASDFKKHAIGVLFYAKKVINYHYGY